MADLQYRLSTHCPRCGAAVRLRNSAKGIQLMRIALESGLEQSDVIQTYQCAKKLDRGALCNTIVEIRLGDWIPVEY